MSLLRYSLIALLILTPVQVFAQQGGSFCPGGELSTITDFFNFVTCLLLQSVVPLLFAAALVLFIFGVIRYVLAAQQGKEADRTQGRQFMIWGIVALFVMVSVWGLVNLLGGTLNLEGGTGGAIPQLKVDEPSKANN